MSEDQNQAIADSDTPPAGLHFDDAHAQADQESLQADLETPRKLGAAGLPIAPIGGQLISSVGGLVGYFALQGTLEVLPYAIAVAAASLIYVAVADLLLVAFDQVNQEAPHEDHPGVVGEPARVQ